MSGPVDPAAVVARATTLLAPLEREAMQAEWDLASRASPEHEAAAERASVAHAGALGDLHDEARAAEAAAADADPVLARQATVLRLASEGRRRPPDLQARIVALETLLAGTFGRHRGVLDGHPADEPTLRRILERETADRARRRGAWEALKSVGEAVAEPLLELVRLRNEAARRLGYRDHYAMSLHLEELDEAWLYGLLDDLDDRLASTWRAEKAAIDDERRAALGLAADAPVLPWDLVDPFGQDAPPPPRDPLAPYEHDLDVVGIARAYYAALGEDVDPILARSDLHPREGKQQHAFQLTLDRAGDVRMQCNIVPAARELETLLHELGHAVYDVHIDRDLPWLVRTPAHILTTEASAMLHGRRGRDGAFLERFAGLPAEVARDPAHRAVARRSLLVFVPWVQVMARFERSLYADPDADHQTAWWDLVERYQRIPRPPEDRRADWCTKIHLALAPVYYHDYLLGETLASQLGATLRRRTGSASPAEHPEEAGAFLREALYRPGARLRWDALVEEATGEALDPRHLVADVS